MKSLVKVLITALTLGLMASVSTLHAQDGGKKGGRGRMSPEQRIANLEEEIRHLHAQLPTPRR